MIQRNTQHPDSRALRGNWLYCKNSKIRDRFNSNGLVWFLSVKVFIVLRDLVGILWLPNG